MNSELDIDAVVRSEWQTILDVPAAGPDDDFFDVGGNSLLAVAFIERVEKRFGVELPLERFFLTGTLAAVVDDTRAAVMSLRTSAARADAEVELRPRSEPAR